MAVSIRRITLSDFRSYASLTVNLSGKPVVLVGANGAGKTNLLEACSMLAAGRGMRGAKLGEVGRQGGTGGWSVVSDIYESGDIEPTRIGVGIEAQNPDKRLVRIDGVPASGPSALLDYLSFVWLTPAQDRLFMDGASERRRFLDRMILAHEPAHGKAATLFEKSMRQRTKLLEDLQRADPVLLGILEQQMAEAGVAIAASRREMTTQLAYGAERLGASAFPVADLALQGELENALAEKPAAQVEDEYQQRLSAMRRRDAEVGRALDGPHRSDLLVVHREKGQAARNCSTGEQKALLIGLVLANAKAMTGGGREASLILLLDEVAAHLDAVRRVALFDILQETGLQSFMTGTDAALFEAWGGRAEQFQVDDSQLAPL